MDTAQGRTRFTVLLTSVCGLTLQDNINWVPRKDDYKMRKDSWQSVQHLTVRLHALICIS
eukprot:58203-Amphidinium_carterae.1